MEENLLEAIKDLRRFTFKQNSYCKHTAKAADPSDQYWQWSEGPLAGQLWLQWSSLPMSMCA